VTKALKKDATYADLWPFQFGINGPGGWLVLESTAKIDRAEKLGIYAREQVRYAWLVEPLQQTLEILRLESGHWSLLAMCSAGERVRAEPFDAVELDLGTLWAA
jgi:hypothetical protein